MKTRIASLVYGRYPSDSRVRRQAEALVRNEYDVDVVALRTDRSQSSYTLKGVNVIHLPMEKIEGGAITHILQYTEFILLAFCWMTWLHIKRRYSVVHINNMPDIIVYCALIPKLCGAKIILDLHDPFPELYSVTSKSQGSGGWALKCLRAEEKMSTAFADHVICTTDFIRDVVVQRGVKRSRTSVVTNAPDNRIFKRPSAEEKGLTPKMKKSFVILYAGTVVERYGVTNIVKALATVRNDIPGLKFRVIGIGEGIEEVKMLAHELKMDEIVEVLPLVPVEKVPAEYVKADALLWLPERNEFIDIILCVKVMEALTMGLPVISTRSKSHAYYFASDEVSFVDSLDPSDLGAAVLDLYRNYESRVPSFEETVKFTEEFGWQNEQIKYLNIIKQLATDESQVGEVRSVEYG